MNMNYLKSIATMVFGLEELQQLPLKFKMTQWSWRLVLCTEQNQVSNLQQWGPHTLLEVFSQSLLGPTDVVPSL